MDRKGSDDDVEAGRRDCADAEVMNSLEQEVMNGAGAPEFYPGCCFC